MADQRVFAIAGLGAFGLELCRVISEKGGKVIAIDNQILLIEKVKDSVTQAVLMDSTDEEALKTLPLDTIDVAVIAIGDDLDASIITTALFKKLGVPYIIARAVKDIHEQVLRQVGATEVINIEIDEGRRMADRLISPDVLDRIPISKSQTLAEILIPKHFAGKRLVDLDLRKKFSINVISIKREATKIDDLGNPLKEEIVIMPGVNDVFEQNDTMVVIGNDSNIDRLKGS